MNQFRFGSFFSFTGTLPDLVGPSSPFPSLPFPFVCERAFSEIFLIIKVTGFDSIWVVSVLYYSRLTLCRQEDWLSNGSRALDSKSRPSSTAGCCNFWWSEKVILSAKFAEFFFWLPPFLSLWHSVPVLPSSLMFCCEDDALLEPAAWPRPKNT